MYYRQNQKGGMIIPNFKVILIQFQLEYFFLNHPFHIKHMFMVGNFAQNLMVYDKFDD